jgi:hypothetical protein
MINCFIEKLKDIMSGDRVATNNGTVTTGEEVLMTLMPLSKQNAWRSEWVHC